MPSTIKYLLQSVQLDDAKVKTCKWKGAVDTTKCGVYFISTSPRVDCVENIYGKAPINEAALLQWIDKIKIIKIDGKPDISYLELLNRLNEFWLPDENIIYIGQTECKGGLKKRISQFYKTALGDRKPHAGGHWIKTLRNLDDLYVHYIETPFPLVTETQILKNFILQVSPSSLKIIGDPNLPLPFANLELDKSNRKRHGITNPTIRL